MSRVSFKYRSYEGSVETSEEDMCLFGQVLFVRDAIIYHAETMPELKAAFEEAVEQYIADCEELGKTPDKPCTGSFNIRIGAKRHRTLSEIAWREDQSINSLVGEAVDLLCAHRKGDAPTHVTFNISTTQAVPEQEAELGWTQPNTQPHLKVVK